MSNVTVIEREQEDAKSPSYTPTSPKLKKMPYTTCTKGIQPWKSFLQNYTRSKGSDVICQSVLGPTVRITVTNLLERDALRGKVLT